MDGRAGLKFVGSLNSIHEENPGWPRRVDASSSFPLGSVVKPKLGMCLHSGSVLYKVSALALTIAKKNPVNLTFLY